MGMLVRCGSCIGVTHPWLAARLGYRCADAGTVEEAVQDAFVAVWRGARYRGEGEVGAWLWGIAIRKLVDRLRRNPAPRLDPPVLVKSAEEAVLAGIGYGELGPAMARLSPELRAVVQAVVLDGLSTREAARLLRVPQGTVKTRMRRARRQLREALT